MNQPLENRLRHIEERLNIVEQQQTEPIKVTIERRQTDTERTLDLHTEMLKGLSTQSDRHTQAFQKVMELLNAHTGAISAVQADVISLKATQSDHGELLKEHSKHFDKLEKTQNEQGQKLDSMQKQLTQIVTLLQQKPS
jgi:chromosome segregation ATPase